ncbi:MAG: cyclodeaminase/cyclohydrolase family protein, partial [Acidobacteria bacterium]|nr:cyclodeaminase/cyclohydrolase family protein [Acidobacteriota bacterium]
AGAVEEDSRAFTQVMEAMRLPKSTADEQRDRDEAIARASRHAASVPLETARLCLQVLELARQAARQGNRHSASDAGVAALVARAGVEGAALNVLTNLPSIKDEAFEAACREEVARLTAAAGRLCDEVLRLI